MHKPVLTRKDPWDWLLFINYGNTNENNQRTAIGSGKFFGARSNTSGDN